MICEICKTREVPKEWSFVAWCDPCLDDFKVQNVMITDEYRFKRWRRHREAEHALPTIQP